MDKTLKILLALILASCLAGCGVSASVQDGGARGAGVAAGTVGTAKAELEHWTGDSRAAASIREYVGRVTDEACEAFIPVEERIAVFCHQGFGLSWLSHLLRIPPNIFWAEFDITHTGVTVLHFSNRKCGRTVPKCLCLSDMSHLAEDGYADGRYHTHFTI